jgi:7,8-dihydropterin-6-yl-methyl-4-(beta-D-ribofuranosyl)aminobenzene 5'-phosphate synthase
MNKIVLAALLFLSAGCIQRSDPSPKEVQEGVGIVLENNSVLNLYDAFGEDVSGVVHDFGFSCMIRYQGKNILFDSGTNASIFKNNVEALGIDLTQIDFAVASHAHFDHINGFDYLLQVNPDVKIYFPFDMFWGANIPFDLSGNEPAIADSLDVRMQYFGGDFKEYKFQQSGRFWNANVHYISEDIEIEPGIKLVFTSSPYMGYFNKYPGLDDSQSNDAQLAGLNEISLSLETDQGEVLFVGCSHSTVEKIITDTKSYTGRDIALVYGGYHLLPYGREDLAHIAYRLKHELGVKKVAPAHCTGHLAFKILQDTYQENYVFAGLGEVVEF